MALPTTTDTSEWRREGFGAALDDTYLQLIRPGLVSQSTRVTTRDPETPAVDTRVNAEEIIDQTSQAFGRDDLTGGSGLWRAHRRNPGDTDPTRYWQSQGVVFERARDGEPAEVRLGPKNLLVEQADSATDSENFWPSAAPIAVAGSFLYYILSDVKNEIVRVARPWAPIAQQSSARIRVPTFDIQGIQTIVATGTTGGAIFIGGRGLLGPGTNAVMKGTGFSAFVHYSAQSVERLWFVKGRLLGASGNRLFEVIEGGTSGDGLLATTLDAGASWTQVIDAGNYVVAFSTDGTVSSFTVDLTSLGVPWILATQSDLPGQVPLSAASMLGTILFGTSTPSVVGGNTVTSESGGGRVWRASIDGEGNLVDQKLIRDWVERSPRAMVAYGESIYVYTYPDVWRYDLATAGFHRWNTVTGTPHNLDLRDGSMVVNMVAVSPDGVGQALGDTNDRVWVNTSGDSPIQTGTVVPNTVVVANSDTPVSQGHVIFPLIDFFTASDKLWTALTLRGTTATGHSIGMWYSTNVDAANDAAHSSWTFAMDIADGASENDFEFTNVESRWMLIQLKFDAVLDTATAVSPVWEAISVRAVPATSEVDVLLTVNVSDRIERPDQTVFDLKGIGQEVYDFLLSKEGKTVDLTLLRTDEDFRGRVVRVDTPSPGSPRRGSSLLGSNVTVRGKRL